METSSQPSQVVARRVAESDGLGPWAAPGAAFVSPAGLRVRRGTLDDLPFIDRLQKANSRALGFLPTMALEGKVRLGEVIIAEMQKSECRMRNEDRFCIHHSAFCLPTPVGYLIASDRYFKRDEVGYVTQMGVVPEHRRSLVAASLLQAQFERSAYGCKLFSCWCAQDLEANRFWEAMGFTAIAFRTGSRVRGSKFVVRGEGQRRTTNNEPRTAPRIHLFWQKRIRSGDTTTPFWYPAQTGGGALREDRLVFPIPPGTHWRDVLPVVLPGMEGAGERDQGSGALEDESTEAGAVEAAPVKLTAAERRAKRMFEAATRAAGSMFDAEERPPTELELKLADIAARDAAWEAIRERMRKHPPKVPVKPLGSGPIWFVPDYNDYAPTDEEIDAEIVASLSVERKRAEARAAKRRAERAAAKVDPRLTAMARELRDRWLETSGAILPAPAKHEVARQLAGPTSPVVGPVPSLPAAA